MEITVETKVKASMTDVWKKWNEPEHIQHWYHASDDWHAPKASNDLQLKGKLVVTMAAKDKSVEFDLIGNYTKITEHAYIEYVLEDGRVVKIVFEQEGDQVKITETFDAETENPLEMQKLGWQAILNNFKKYVEY